MTVPEYILQRFQAALTKELSCKAGERCSCNEQRSLNYAIYTATMQEANSYRTYTLRVLS